MQLARKKAKINQSGILNKNFLAKKLVKLVQKFVKLVIKTSNKVQKLKKYKKVINNLIYKNKWQNIIDKKL